MKVYVATYSDYGVEPSLFGVYKTLDKAFEDAKTYLLSLFPNGNFSQLTRYEDSAYLRLYGWTIDIEEQEVKE